MPKTPKVSSKRKKIVTIVVVVLLLVAAVAAGVIFRLLQGGQKGPSDQTGAEVKGLPSVVSQVQDLNNEGKTAEAEKLAQDQLNDPSTSSEIKYMLYIQQGNAKFNAGDVKGSIEFYLKAFNAKQTQESAQLLGDAYAQIGDKAAAIDYYKKAIDLTSPDRPTAEDEKESLRQMIRNLGGQA